jgi:hypothetical protein
MEYKTDAGPKARHLLFKSLVWFCVRDSSGKPGVKLLSANEDLQRIARAEGNAQMLTVIALLS